MFNRQVHWIDEDGDEHIYYIQKDGTVIDENGNIVEGFDISILFDTCK